MREPWTYTVAQAFTIIGRGTAVVGTHAGGDINNGDAAVTSNGLAIRKVFIDLACPGAKWGLLLPGVEESAVPAGTVLSGPAAD